MPPKKTRTDDDTLHDLLGRGTVTIIDRDHLEKRLRSGKPLRIKFGIDPSGPDIHLGHAVILRKLRQLQEAGHQIVIVIGDWTARIGDPTDRNEMRPQLSPAEVGRNAKLYLKQLFHILDKDRTQITWQSDWFDNFTLQDVFTLLSRWTVAQLLDRDDFKKRLSEGIEVAYHEPIYSILQAYDSVMVKADVEIGATEQLFNLLRGRDLQTMMGQPPQDIITMELLLGLEGKRKMGKSHHNYIAILDTPIDMYGKVMSIPDTIIAHYFELATELPVNEVQEFAKQIKERSVNPRDLKMRLAREIVTLYHSPAAARKAEEHFVRVFQARELPEKIKTIRFSTWPKTLAHALVDTELAGSMSEARRVIRQGGVKVDGKPVTNPSAPLPETGTITISRGKRLFRRLEKKG